MSQARLYSGDAVAVLDTLPAGSCRTCVTSPPYWGLRDYGTAEWVGGDTSCSHKVTAAPISATVMWSSCHCGAHRVDQQLGLESTPEEYVANLVAVFRAVRRVLTDDGTLWLNLGDGYVANGARGDTKMGFNDRYFGTARGHGKQGSPGGRTDHRMIHGIKPKDLVGIPWRVAFALQADGWYLRSDIIWSKPNPMPESVRDRPTKAHESVFFAEQVGAVLLRCGGDR